jgi:hypothetical protein
MGKYLKESYIHYQGFCPEMGDSVSMPTLKSAKGRNA